MDQPKSVELRQRALAILAAAETVKDPECRATLLRLAASYEDMAIKLEMTTASLGRWDIGHAGTRH